jgi:hypothetical protein
VFSEDFSGASVASYAASDLTFLPADKSVRGPVSASCSQVVITLWPSDELNRRQVQSARCRLPGPPAITSEVSLRPPETDPRLATHPAHDTTTYTRIAAGR